MKKFLLTSAVITVLGLGSCQKESDNCGACSVGGNPPTKERTCKGDAKYDIYRSTCRANPDARWVDNF